MDPGGANESDDVYAVLGIRFLGVMNFVSIWHWTLSGILSCSLLQRQNQQ